MVIFDISLEIYHQVCFRLYSIPLISRSAYIRIDRYRLGYLTWEEKLDCLYCGYANGLVHYASVIAAETEKYWCGIKHRKEAGFHPPAHHRYFLSYGDEAAFQTYVNKKIDE